MKQWTKAKNVIEFKIHLYVICPDKYCLKGNMCFNKGSICFVTPPIIFVRLTLANLITNEYRLFTAEPEQNEAQEPPQPDVEDSDIRAPPENEPHEENALNGEDTPTNPEQVRVQMHSVSNFNTF